MGQLPVATRHIAAKSPRQTVFGASARTLVVFLLRAYALTFEACRDTVSFCLLPHRKSTTNIGDLEWKTQEHRNPKVFVLSWTMSRRKTSTSACSINQEVAVHDLGLLAVGHDTYLRICQPDSPDIRHVKIGYERSWNMSPRCSVRDERATVKLLEQCDCDPPE